MHVRLSSLLLTIIALSSILLFFPHVKGTSTETLYPNAVGDSSACSHVGGSGPNWDCVDETPYDTTTYVYSPSTDSSPRLDLYNIQASSIPSGSTINSVSVYAVCRSISNTYKASFRMSLKKSGGSTQYGTPNQPTTTYTLYGSGFTGILQTDLDALQIGIEIESGDHDPTFYSGRCTQVYAVIDYTLVAQGTWNTITTWSTFLVTRTWQSSGTWTDFLIARSWQLSASWSNYLVSRAWQTAVYWSNFLISRTWQNVALWNINLLALGWHTVTVWSILLLGEDATTIIIILFLFSVVGFTCFGLYRKKRMVSAL